MNVFIERWITALSQGIHGWMPHPDRRTLRTEQYASSANLNARLAIHERFSTNAYGWHRWVFDRLLRIDPNDILEVGCGPATLWQTNAARRPAHWRILLSDFSIGMVDEARRVVGGNDAFRFAVFDAGMPAVRRGSFDCVVANHMLYHLPDRVGALRAVANALSAGGCLIASTNGAGHLHELDALARRHGFALEALSSAPFTLENGGAQLQQTFAEVTLETYDDSLAVDDAEALVAYVLSAAPTAGNVETLRREVTDGIAADGRFRVRKEAGLFVARGPRVGEKESR